MLMTERTRLTPEEKKRRARLRHQEWRRRKIESDPTFLKRESERTSAIHKANPEMLREARKRRLEKDPLGAARS